MNPFEKALASALKSRFAPEGRFLFLAALSGGADSVSMTAALAALRDAGALPPAFMFHCLHVNHGIRSPEVCAADAETAAALCGELKFPLSVKTLEPGLVEAHARERGTGLEAAARYFRHAFFKEEKRRLRADCILIAHTRDDLLETILMALLRGAGSAGLGGMRMRSGSLLRPLLLLSRSDVLDYLKGRGLSFRVDESNADTRYLRNRVRHILIPRLNASFPGWQKPLLRLWETQGLTADFLAREAASRIPWRKSGNSLSVDSRVFFEADEIIREEALFRALDRYVPPDLSSVCSGRRAAGTIRRSALRPFIRGKTAVLDLGQARLENRKGRITLGIPQGVLYEENFSVLIKRPGVYKLTVPMLFNVVKMELLVSPPEDPRGDGFFAGFPLVLTMVKPGPRGAVKPLSGCPGGLCIAARDRKGPAALLGGDGSVLWKRTTGADTAGAYFAVK
ncbi:MAG: tRNA lysidine(34) synthetase TilS [Treponema sp.]|jgi:tRNA(Ile)-lysidine synthase|nr:tRNA lysidine(34) synthetase TilS [Treponema sp.]